MEPLNTVRPAPAGSGAAIPADGPTMEVAHVLFMDIVGYSKLRMNQQAAAQVELQNLVNASAEVQKAKGDRKFICRPTGDGMALLFFRDIVSPVRTALQIHELMHKRAGEIRTRVGANIKVRMGIHSGTILMVEDLNAQSDAAGDGINIAQRVMDCGDDDHILLSKKVAESLLSIDPWQRYLTDIGPCRVKHGTVVHLYNLRGRLETSPQMYGNPAIPARVLADQNEQNIEASRYRGSLLERRPETKKQIAAAIVLTLLAGGAWRAWTTVPAVPKFFRDTYARVSKPGGGATKEAANKGKATSGGKPSSGKAKASGGGSGGGSASRRPSAAGGATESRRVTVPEVVGHTLDDAQALVEGDGLKVARSDKSDYNKQYGEGTIYQQTPAAGATAAKNTTIYVRISKGDPPDGTTPDSGGTAE